MFDKVDGRSDIRERGGGDERRRVNVEAKNNKKINPTKKTKIRYFM